jgi:SAM-dependent methyltransferase
MLGVTGSGAEYRLYGELAQWWPLISPPQEYADEAAFVASVLRSAQTPTRDVLELGSGGGNNAVHLKQDFSMTLADASPEMLAVSEHLNPECEHIRGDMRDLRLGRSFDAVFVHDAVDYMTTENDLERVIRSAFEHCRPGGIAVFVPDHTTEIFEPATEHGGGDAADGRGARFLAWTWDPDPSDTAVVTEYAFLLREADGTVRTLTESHRTGLFRRKLWLRLLERCGFEGTRITEQTDDDRVGRDVFIGKRPEIALHLP